MLPLLPASMAAHVVRFSATSAGGMSPGRTVVEYRATECTVYVADVLVNTPRKKLGCVRVTCTPTRSHGFPSYVWSTVWATPLPSDVPCIRVLPSVTGFVTVTVVEPTVTVAVRAPVSVVHVAEKPAHADVIVAEVGIVPPRFSYV